MNVFDLTAVTLNPMNSSFWEIAHQLPGVVASHLDVSTSRGGRGTTPRPVDLRGTSQLLQSMESLSDKSVPGYS